MKRFINRHKMIILISILFIAAIYFIYQKITPKKLPDNLVSATGRMDGDLINLNTKYSGRIKSIFVDDGECVKKLQVVAILKSNEYEAKKQQIENQIKMLKNQLKARIEELKITEKAIPNTIEKAKLNIKIAQHKKEISTDNIHKLQLKIEQNERDFKRYKNLYRAKAINRRTLELSKLKLDSDAKQLKALKEELKIADKSIRLAKIDLKDATDNKKKINALKDNIAALKEQVKAFEASKKEIEAVCEEMVIKSPIDGYVVERIANVGEVLGPGMSVATLIDPHSLYLKVFVDTVENGKIKLGDKAVIFLDAYPNKPVEAKVTAIAQQAEFTPKEVSVRSDRIQRVYAIHLKPVKINPLLKLGIPAIGVISLDGKGLPHSLNEIPKL